MTSPALDREAVDQALSRGSDLLKQGKLEEAQTAFRTALLLDGENPRTLALLGLTHFRAGQFGQARPIYEELVERAPTDPSHRLNLGLVYLKLGDSDKAIGSLEASRALDPSQGKAVSYLGLAYARAGRYAEAYRSFLMAGQQDLATEIEVNLTDAERDSILAQLQRPGGESIRTRAPSAPPPRITPAIGIPETPQVSMPEILIDRGALTSEAPPPPTPGFESAVPEAMSQSEAEIALGGLEASAGNGEPVASATEHHEVHTDLASEQHEIQAPQMSDSLQFVLPEREAVPTPADGQSIVSRAVEVATPSTSSASPGSHVAWGSTPPVPLSQLATEQLVRPEDGDSTFEVTAAGALVIRVSERVLTRLDGIHVTGGELEFEPAMRKSRGHLTDDKFNYGGTQLHVVSGNGYLIAVPGDRKFTAVSLDDDILYLREDMVFAFEATLRWENGNVPGLRGKLPVVQFRGDGAVALRSDKPLVRVKLPAQGVLFVEATRLAGWIGRVIPRAVVPPKHGPMGDVCVECTGEGVVLIDPHAAAPAVVSDRPRTPSKSPELTGKHSPPPPPQPPAPIELDVVKSADWLSDDDMKDEASGDDTKRDEI
ncbi:MAG TPA: tetratricopeptide repeat protein [Kofleriaceae bacterium]|nr:tetratricopeptide repeat protein [Kofleriaceae bacterium]